MDITLVANLMLIIFAGYENFISRIDTGDNELMWVVIIHLALMFSDVLFALMDRIAGRNHAAKGTIATE